jgi:hypothetical protein
LKKVQKSKGGSGDRKNWGAGTAKASTKENKEACGERGLLEQLQKQDGKSIISFLSK